MATSSGGELQLLLGPRAWGADDGRSRRLPDADEVDAERVRIGERTRRPARSPVATVPWIEAAALAASTGS